MRSTAKRAARREPSRQADALRYGVVIDGLLAAVVATERVALDHAAESRRLGCEAQVIRIPHQIRGL
jgi:hypothetical protein